jgi:hypothetical protein
MKDCHIYEYYTLLDTHWERPDFTPFASLTGNNELYSVFVYQQNTTKITGGNIYYLRHNHMFRPQLLAIFKLYGSLSIFDINML